jgi:1-pyrroline-5-carboxylate dehydrogenase
LTLLRFHQVCPHNHKKKIAQFYYADKDLLTKAIDTAVAAQKKWDRTPIPERLKIWEKAASLMANEYRQTLNAATMLGQAKTVIQAEIDSAAELIDFFRRAPSPGRAFSCCNRCLVTG